MISPYLFVLAQTPEAFRFRRAFSNVRHVQEQKLYTYLRQNQATRFGREHQFARIRDIATYRQHVPIHTYQEFQPYIEAIQQGESNVLTQENVLYLMPTGGTSGTKLIPYTRTLKREFQQALAPWLADLSRAFPAILNGPTYWSLTPPGNKLKRFAGAQIPVGFEDDSAYFGWQGRLIGNLFVVPGWITQIHSMANFHFLTLYFLLKTQHLRWISIWSPTFLLVLLQELEKYGNQLCLALTDGLPHLPEAERLPVELRRTPMPERAKVLEHALTRSETERYSRIWPELVFISLWNDAYAQYPAQQVARCFPHTFLQGKGLLATEGVMTIPIHAAQGCIPAFTSHFLEFIGTNQQIRGLWELEADQTYTVLLTTGGGFYRYAIGDLVHVTGFYRQLPILRFVGRKGRYSDLVGEKLEEQFVHTALERILQATRIECTFVLLAPEEFEQQRGYVLFIESCAAEPLILAFANQLEQVLRTNLHYNFAVQMRQLAPLRVFQIKHGGQQAYLQRGVDAGQQLGDIKPLLFDPRTGWKHVFHGGWLQRSPECKF